jgi:hypothetical protein
MTAFGIGHHCEARSNLTTVAASGRIQIASSNEKLASQ